MSFFVSPFIPGVLRIVCFPTFARCLLANSLNESEQINVVCQIADESYLFNIFFLLLQKPDLGVSWLWRTAVRMI